MSDGTVKDASNLAALLRSTLLPGRRARMAKDVQEWAAEAGIAGDDAAVLNAYNEAFEESVRSARSVLDEWVLDPEGKDAAIAILNRQGTTDAERLLALDALEHVVSTNDTAPLARVNVNQRPAVLPKALKVIAASGGAEAMFVLRKMFGESSSDVADDAARLGDGLAEDAVEDASSDADLFRLLASTLSEQNAAAPAAELASAAIALDARLLEAARGAGTLNPYDLRLRDAVHDLAIAARWTSTGQLWERALESVFRDEDTSRVRRLAPFGGSALLIPYITRSLTPDNRRGPRRDRVLAALELIRQAPDDVRTTTRRLTVEALEEQDAEVRATAATTLLTTYEDLAGPERRTIARVFEQLPTALQPTVAPHLARISEEVTASTDISELLKAVVAAAPEDLPIWLERLDSRWSQTDVDPNRIPNVAGIYLKAAARLSEADQRRWEERFARTAAVWIRGRRGRFARAISALVESERASDALLAHFPALLEDLRTNVARRLLAELLAPTSAAASSRLVEAATLSVNDEQLARVALPELAAATAAAPRQAAEAFAKAGPDAQRCLLAAALVATGDLSREIDRLTVTLEEQTTEAMVAAQAQVEQALSLAVDAARGNPALLEQFGAIQRAVSGEKTGSDVYEPSAAVRDWRVQAARKLGIDFADGRQVLKAAGDPDTNALRQVISDLDRRVHGRGTVPAPDRPHYRADLMSLLETAIANELSPGEVRGSPALAQEAWRMWASHVDDLPTALVDALATESNRPEDLLRTYALARVSDSDAALSAAERVADPALDGAWHRVNTGLEHAAREVTRLREAARTEEDRILEQIAGRLSLPFEAIESVMFSYFRLRQTLADAGWKPVAEHLGDPVRTVDPDKHRIEGSPEADQFYVRSMGIRVGSRAVSKAVIEPGPDVEPSADD